MRPLTPALPAVDQIDSPRVILRDGTAASVRVANAADREAIRDFFHELSPESRRKRFFTPALPADALIARLADSSDPSTALTLIVQRFHPAVAAATFETLAGRDEDVRPVAIASYFADDARVAEVAFAVADDFQGKGLSTMLL